MVNVQRHAGQLRAKLLHALGKHGLFGVAHAVVQLHHRGLGRVGHQRFQPGHKRRGANACGHPHLLGGTVLAEVESPVRPLHPHLLAHGHLLRQSRGVVAQRLDGEAQAAIAGYRR